MKIAIIRLSSLGDIIHTSIVLQFIKLHINKAEIYWFCDSKFSEILLNHPLIKEVISLPLKQNKIIKSFQILKQFRLKFDIIIDFQGLIKSSIVGRILGSNLVGFNKNSIKEPLACLFYKNKFDISYDENIIIRNLSLASFALNFSFKKDEILHKSPCFGFSHKPFILKSKNYIILAPFASEISKCYNKFKELINGLAKYEIFVCFGTKHEKKLALDLILDTHAKLLPELSLKQMLEVVNNCSLLIGNDSGITHMAWAQNRPSIAIFGNRPSQRNAFKTPINSVIDAGKEVNSKRIDKTDFCINLISPNLIINEAKRLLNE